MQDADDRPMPWWLRAYLLFGAAETLYVGGKGMLIPEQLPLPLTVTPLNARFTAALYLTATVVLLLAALVRQRADARIFTLGFSLAVTLISGVTLLHWSEFTANWDVARWWVGLYALDVALAAIMVVPIIRLYRSFRPARHRFTTLITVVGVLLAVLGAVLLLAPPLAAAIWPWALPPVLAQLYSCFFITYAVCAFLAARESRPLGVRLFLIMTLALASWVLLASLLHLQRFRADPTTWVWFGVLAAGLLVCGLALLQRDEAPARALGVPPGA